MPSLDELKSRDEEVAATAAAGRPPSEAAE
jgi:hypothetical protein